MKTSLGYTLSWCKQV